MSSYYLFFFDEENSGRFWLSIFTRQICDVLSVVISYWQKTFGSLHLSLETDPDPTGAKL